MLLVLTAISMLVLLLQVVLGRWTNRISLVYNFLGQIFTKIELKYRNSGSYIYPQIVKLCLCQHWLFCLCHHSFCKGTNQVSKSWNSANFLVGKYCSAMVVAIMSTRRSIKLAPNNWLLCYRVAFSVLYTPPTNFSCSPTNPPLPDALLSKNFFFCLFGICTFFLVLYSNGFFMVVISDGDICLVHHTTPDGLLFSVASDVMLKVIYKSLLRPYGNFVIFVFGDCIVFRLPEILLAHVVW